MPDTRAQELALRRRTPDPELWTFAESFDRRLDKLLERTLHIQFPNPHYQRDPVTFCREILGVEPWEKQWQIMELVRDHDRVAICSGHKVSKSHTAASLALWYYCSFPDARVVMTSTTSRQVDQILWRELRMIRARSGRCVECKERDPEGLLIKRPCEHSALIDGEQGELARTGLKSEDFREIVGFTAKESEAVAGISGRNLFYIADEASGIDDLIFEAIEGNRAGGAKLLLLSQGTRNSGEFYEAFYGKSKLYATMRISSEDTPNYKARKLVIPGLATYEWCEDKKQEWGEASPLYQIRVKGQHALQEEAKIFTVHAITQAEQRWPSMEAAGRLFVGLDPAGESGLGDDTCFAIRRGMKLLTLRTQRGLNDEQHLVQLLILLTEFRLPRETPVVVLDREGRIGASLAGRLRNFTEMNPNAFELVTVRASDKAQRKPHIYDRARDELAANLEQWFRDGGAIPEDVKLATELHVLEWKQAINGRLKLTPKELIRKLIGRSPDRYDAFALSAWEPLSLSSGDLPPSAATATREGADAVTPYAEQTIDPYGGNEWWRSR